MILVAVSMIAVPMNTLATHNSAGASVAIAQADEVDRETGELRPDVPSAASPNSNSDHPFLFEFHENLDEPRKSPADQTGERYTDCTPWSDYQANADNPSEAYKDDLISGEACYIGYFDAQMEYILPTFLGPVVPQSDNDGLYPANPTDGYCDGTRNTGDRGFDAPDEAPNSTEDAAEETVNSAIVGEDSAADEAATQAARADDSECSGSGHKTYGSTYAKIDQDLLEGPLMGSDADGGDDPGVTDVVGTEEASGTQTLPFSSNHYIFIFGQPHPNNTAPSQVEAGEGLFGAPIIGIGDACGDRTQECKLLTPDDIIAYDQHAPDAPGAGQNARVCEYLPQFSVLNPSPSAGLCGLGGTGTRAQTFVPSATQGGLNATEAPTFLTTQPGWYGNSAIVLASNVQTFFDEEATPVPIERPCQSDKEHASLCGDYFNDEKKIDNGTVVFYAVNPRVPTPDHELFCATPNILGGQSNDDPITDQFRGYTADALDTDVYLHSLHGPTLDVRNATHDPVREATRPIEPFLDATTPAEIIQGDPEGVVADAVAEQFPALAEPIQRADFTEEEDAESTNDVSQNDEEVGRSTIETEAGLGCDPTGVVKDRSGGTFDTGARLTVNVEPAGGVSVSPIGIPITSFPAIEPKDPTLTEDGLPANEENTEQGAWAPHLYSFGGGIHGVIDTNENGQFDACTLNTGTPQPDRDRCAWRGLWDAYNDECTGEQENKCFDLLNASGYDVGGEDEDEPSGVGAYFVIRLTGPFVVVDEDRSREGEIQERTRIVGDESAGDQSCVVGVSTGFGEHLPDHFDGAQNMDDVVDQVCAGSDGEHVLIEDAFDDQGGAGGGFSAAVQFGKLVPTPKLVRDDLGTQFGEGDEVCVNSIFTVQDGWGGPTNDTASSIALHDGSISTLAGDEPWHFEDCDSLETKVKQ